jgi:regulator of ribonuclease activity A
MTSISTSTCDLCDTYKADTTGNFRVLPPVFPSYGGIQKFSGPVSTVKCFEDNTSVKRALDEPGAGRVLVVDGAASLSRALVGGNIAAAAAKNGWAGVIVNGCVRDAAELAATPVGLRALALNRLPTHPAPRRGRAQCGGANSRRVGAAWGLALCGRRRGCCGLWSTRVKHKTPRSG